MGEEMTPPAPLRVTPQGASPAARRSRFCGDPGLCIVGYLKEH